MADMNDLFFFGDDFEAILDILETDENLDEQFAEAVDEVSIQLFLKFHDIRNICVWTLPFLSVECR